MNKSAEWIEDLLGAAKTDTTGRAINMIEKCGEGCARRKNAVNFAEELRKKQPGV